MSFKIESNIPIVTRRGRRGTEFPFSQMEVGDSFLIECDVNDKKTVDSWRRRIMTAKKTFSKAHGGAFQSSMVDNGLRVWRSA